MRAGEEVIKNIEQRPAARVIRAEHKRTGVLVLHVAKLLEECSLESWRSDGVTPWQLKAASDSPRKQKETSSLFNHLIVWLLRRSDVPRRVEGFIKIIRSVEI